MARYSFRQYQLRVFAAMAVYVGLVLLVWPHARTATAMALKVAFALAPTLPVLVVIWFMARRVMQSDELQQRVDLVALSVATGVVSALSLAAGFLNAAHVIAVDGDILMWVFPAICIVYGATRLWVGKRYGGIGCD
ncbi:MAG TPA: hypothetical protein VFB32_01455 [Rudaea sp.]|jgi:hypothetical protein|nr:hypothetical protein [Rudaea sp.]